MGAFQEMIQTASDLKVLLPSREKWRIRAEGFVESSRRKKVVPQCLISLLRLSSCCWRKRNVTARQLDVVGGAAPNGTVTCVLTKQTNLSRSLTAHLFIVTAQQGSPVFEQFWVPDLRSLPQTIWQTGVVLLAKSVAKRFRTGGGELPKVDEHFRQKVHPTHDSYPKRWPDFRWMFDLSEQACGNYDREPFGAC